MLKGLGTQQVTYVEKVACLSSNGMHCDSPLVVRKLVTDKLSSEWRSPVNVKGI